MWTLFIGPNMQRERVPIFLFHQWNDGILAMTVWWRLSLNQEETCTERRPQTKSTACSCNFEPTLTFHGIFTAHAHPQ